MFRTLIAESGKNKDNAVKSFIDSLQALPSEYDITPEIEYEDISVPFLSSAVFLDEDEHYVFIGFELDDLNVAYRDGQWEYEPYIIESLLFYLGVYFTKRSWAKIRWQEYPEDEDCVVYAGCDEPTPFERKRKADDNWPQ